MPRGSLPKVNSTTLSSTMPSATVAISQEFEPRITNGRTATRRGSWASASNAWSKIAFAPSGLLAGIAGILVAPLFTISSTMGTLFGIKAFAVAILGGIESAWGVVLAGLIYGVAEALITALLGSTYTQIVTFALVILALAVRPNGLFGRAQLRKV